MIEMLLGLSGNQDRAILMDIDFSLSAFGSADIVDRGISSWELGGTANTVKAVDDSEMGRVMEFSGGGYYTANRQPAFDLASTSWRLETVIRRTSTAQQVVFSTGDYNQIRVYGLLHSINYSTTVGHQIFVDNGSWARILSNSDPKLVWERLVVTRRRGVGYTVEVYRDDVLYSTIRSAGDPPPGIGGSIIRLGASIDPASARFTGRIKSYKISLIQ